MADTAETLKGIAGVVVVFFVGSAVVNYLKEEARAEAAEPYIVTSVRLNCRLEPTVQSPPLTTLGQGDMVRVREWKRGWARIQHDSISCWVSSRFLSTTNGENPNAASVASGPVRIPLIIDGGIYKVPGTLNSDDLDFVVDSGSGDVAVPEEVYRRLFSEGSVGPPDITGDRDYVLADGSIHRAMTFKIRSLVVGGVELRDVDGSVSPEGSPLLLGQSYLGRLHSWSQDNRRHELVLE